MTLDAELGELSNLSRVELEPVLAHRVADGDIVGADAIRDELAARPWQGHNPYAPVDTARALGLPSP